MNLGELKTAVRNRSGIFLDATAVTEFVNAAVQQLATERDWPWLEKSANISTANGTGEYAVPADWSRTVAVLSSTNIPLRHTPIKELDYIGGSGSPRLFGIFGDQVVVRPIPTAIETLKHRYVATTPQLSADGDVPTIPVSYHHAIVEYATFLVQRHAGNLERANIALGAYEKWRDQMAEQLDRFSESEGGAHKAEEELEQVTRLRSAR